LFTQALRPTQWSGKIRGAVSAWG